ncbi:hypothetical protein CHUAL_006476 [Chamberlinius hualienensis]
MSSFTCISCRVAFQNGEIQRAHYKTDWHRYNLKRKVSELPPVTAENFQQRVLAHRPELDTEKEEPSQYCNICHKHFNNRKSYENHVKSRKHLEAENQQEQLKVVGKNKTLSGNLRKDDKNQLNVAAVKNVEKNVKEMEVDDDDDEDEEGWEDVEEEPLQLEECLFCSELSSTLEDNIKHMTEQHSFFIPDLEYVVNLPGLIGYLDEKVGAGNMCLWCNEKGKSFYSTRSAQQHMLDKGHCKMIHEGEALEEYADFYDYSQSYPEGTGEANEDEEVSSNVLEDEGYQLVLPSGATVGHRSLMRYYRQNLRPARPNANRKMLNNVMSHYRGLGWTGTTGEAAIRKAKDLSLMHMKRSKHHMKLGVKANKLQRYFRLQNPM